LEDDMRSTQKQVIGGVDTHQDIHVAAAVDELGRVIGSQSFPTTARGYALLLSWLRRKGTVLAVGVEGTGSWGAGLSRYLQTAGVRIVEVNRPNRQLRRQRGKSDPVDAEAAARAVLAGQASVVPKAADGQVECMRMVRIARRGAIKARTQAMSQLRAVLATAPDELRARFRDLPTLEVIERASRLHTAPPGDPEAATKFVLASLARRWSALDAEAKSLSVELRYLVAATSRAYSHGPASALTAPARCSSPPATTQRVCAPTPRSPRCAGRARLKPRPARSFGIDSIAAATARRTVRSGGSSSCGCGPTRGRVRTSSGDERKAAPRERSCGA
jgi:transposase